MRNGSRQLVTKPLGQRLKEKSHPHSCAYIVTSVLCVLIDFPFGHDLRMLGENLLGGRSIPVQISWLLWTRVHGSVIRAFDCRLAGPWFNSGWRSWFTFMTCSHNPMNQISQMFISKSPITRKSVKSLSCLDKLELLHVAAFRIAELPEAIKLKACGCFIWRVAVSSQALALIHFVLDIHDRFLVQERHSTWATRKLLMLRVGARFQTNCFSRRMPRGRRMTLITLCCTLESLHKRTRTTETARTRGHWLTRVCSTPEEGKARCYEVPSKQQLTALAELPPSRFQTAELDSEEEGERDPVPTGATLHAEVANTVLQGQWRSPTCSIFCLRLLNEIAVGGCSGERCVCE